MNNRLESTQSIIDRVQKVLNYWWTVEIREILLDTNQLQVG